MIFFDKIGRRFLFRCDYYDLKLVLMRISTFLWQNNKIERFLGKSITVLELAEFIFILRNLEQCKFHKLQFTIIKDKVK